MDRRLEDPRELGIALRLNLRGRIGRGSCSETIYKRTIDHAVED